MVRFSSSSRFSSVNLDIILTQTDTTVGFLSKDEKKLKEIKSRGDNKPFIKVYHDFKTFLASGNRIPSSKKNLVRRTKKTTFIVKNRAFRVSDKNLDSQILRNTKWNYSTSANESGKNFQREFCELKADIIIEDKKSLYEAKSSSLYKINSKKVKRLR